MTIFGKSIKTTALGYIIAALVAAQPFFTSMPDFNSRSEMVKFIWQIAIAIGIAVFGRMAADSAQVKEVKRQADYNSAVIDEHLLDTTSAKLTVVPPSDETARDES